MKATIAKHPTLVTDALARLAASFSRTEELEVGVPRGSNPYPDGTPVALVAAAHEFGSPDHGIPERSFIRSALHEGSKKYAKSFTKSVNDLISNDTSDQTSARVLNKVGEMAAADVKRRITTLDSPELKDSTKRRKGSSNPLMDTGHLRQTITYTVT